VWLYDLSLTYRTQATTQEVEIMII